MKTFMLSAAIAAIALPLASCADEKTNSQQVETRRPAAAPGESAKAAPVTSASSAEKLPVTASTASISAVRYPGATDISVRAFLGELIFGDAGESLAGVVDTLIGADGAAERIIYRTGDVGGVGGKISAVPFDKVNVSLENPESATSKDDPLLRLSMTEDQIKSAPDFNQVGDDDYRLATEILGAEIHLVSAPKQDLNAAVDDLIMAHDGHVKAVIVQRSMIGSVRGGDRYAFDYQLLRIEEGDGQGLALDISEAQFNGAQKFEYKRSDAINEAVESAKNPDDKN